MAWPHIIKRQLRKIVWWDTKKQDIPTFNTCLGVTVTRLPSPYHPYVLLLIPPFYPPLVFYFLNFLESDLMHLKLSAQ